jgi:hypothetical protein
MVLLREEEEKAEGGRRETRLCVGVRDSEGVAGRGGGGECAGGTARQVEVCGCVVGEECVLGQWAGVRGGR